MFSGYPQEALMAFSWCLLQTDQKRVTWHDQNLLWNYKWIVSHLTNFPSVSRRKIAEIMNDLFRRYEQVGAGPRIRHYLTWLVHWEMGEIGIAEKAYRDWKQFSPDEHCDCHACEIDQEVHYLSLKQEAQSVFDLAAPILAGRRRCSEVPHRTYATLLAPALALGREEEAHRYHQKGYRMVKGNDAFMIRLSYHLIFLVKTGMLEEGVRMVEKHLPRVLQSKVPLFQAAFLFAAVRLLSDAALAFPRIKGPRDLPVDKKGVKYETASMKDYLEGIARSLAERFDERNGNMFYKESFACVQKNAEFRLYPG